MQNGLQIPGLKNILHSLSRPNDPEIKHLNDTLPETNIAHENPHVSCKYPQNGGFSMAMLVLGSVFFLLGMWTQKV